MITDSTYRVKKLHYRGPFTVKVPGSKSITNRALMLAAMSDRRCVLDGVLFSDDSAAFLDCLDRLGFELDTDEPEERVVIQGTGGEIPNRSAAINVRSAGTAARFLTVMLALAGGDYEINSSTQMMRRPMEPLISILRSGGVEFEFLGEEGHFPFKLHSHGVDLKSVTVDTTVSSQFTSALLMAGTLLDNGLDITVTGNRTDGAYIKMTLAMMKQFGIDVGRDGTRLRVDGGTRYGVERYVIEPDVSAASYFYSLAPLLGSDVRVNGVHRQSLQGDIKYVELLEGLGCRLSDSETGLWVLGSGVGSYPGIKADMKDFSDQAMTMAAVAVYAESATDITGIGHIRYQESDRMAAIITELNRMGVDCVQLPEEEGIRIIPGVPAPALVETYEDHRMAMAFALTGVRTEGIVINNPSCCRKTFENYFEVLDSLYVKPDVKAILIDNDNTMMDFEACARNAVRASFERAKLRYTDELAKRYILHNNHMWERLEKREITRQQLFDMRWQTFFDSEGISFDGIEFERIYRDELEKQHVTFEGLDELLSYLSGRYDIYIATNGAAVSQQKRIKDAGIDVYFKDCFISELIGADKPSYEYFDKCMERIGLPADKVMIIGDSLTADMKGGADYGLVTCWFNNKHMKNISGIHCDYVAESYNDIMQIL